MTSQEKQWFERLREVKQNLVEAHDAADDPIEGWFADEDELYSDTAHFVYELLQNADDAGSSEARFVLCDDKLVFAHKGEHTKRFTISSHDSKKNDIGTGRYGSVNALTDRNGTTKKEDNEKGNAIGKFGRGFKSVYGYTRTPHVYDENIRFKLERIIIPIDLSGEQDYEGREQGETLFVLPFDRKGKGKEPTACVKDILKKFTELVMPTLFLRNLKTIGVGYKSFKGQYTKTISVSKEFPNGDIAEFVEMSFQCDETLPEGTLPNTVQELGGVERLWVFSRGNGLQERVSVGFFVDDNGVLDKNHRLLPAFCYFPTRHATGLKFIIQAPFRLTANREGILDELKEPHNGHMVESLAKLTADCIEYLRDIKDATGKSLITDDVLDIIPTCLTKKADYKDCLDLSPFSSMIREKFGTARVIPTKSGNHVTRDNACWPNSEDISIVFSEEQLRFLLNRPDLQWAFATQWADLKKIGNSKYEFIASVLRNVFPQQNGLPQPCKAENLLKIMSSEFIGRQSVEWLFHLHDWIARDERPYGRRYQVKKIPIFLNQCGEPISAYDADGKPQLLKPSKNGCAESRKQKTVHGDFLKNPSSCTLLDCYGAHEPKVFDDIKMLLGNEWDAKSDDEHVSTVRMVFDELPNLMSDDQKEIIENLRRKQFLAIDCNGQRSRKLCKELYLQSEDVASYFQDTEACFLDVDRYFAEGDENGKAGFIGLIEKLGGERVPRIHEQCLSLSDFPYDYNAHDFIVGGNGAGQKRRGWGQPSNANYSKQTWKEPEIEFFSGKLKALLGNDNINDKKITSILLWNILRTLIMFYFNKEKTPDQIQSLLFKPGKHEYINYSPRDENFENLLLFKLRNSSWLVSRDGTFRSPSGMTTQELAEDYDLNGTCGAILQEILQLKSSIEDIRGSLLDGLCRHIREIGCRNKDLAVTSKKIEESTHSLRQKGNNPQASCKAYQDAIQAAGSLIETNEEVQNDLLTALRRRIGQIGYGPEKLLFELFQNADDAYKQNEVFHLGAVHDGCEFLVKWDRHNDRLVVVYWGRPINKKHESIPGSERDLENMLQMHQSDKQVEGVADVTGKFGLGFKTVFLVSDVPCLLSGDLNLKILGGYLPCDLTMSEPWVRELRQHYAANEQLPPTIVVLPLRPDSTNAMESAWKAFKDSAPYLVNCARCVKKITIEE